MMNKKIILSAIMATSVLLTSCGRDDEPTKTTTNEGNPTAPAKPSEPAPKPSQPEERPSEDDLRFRTYANKWKVAPEVYLERIDIADLYNNPEKITIDVLKELATFQTLDGTRSKSFTLKDEDLQHLKIRDLKYDRDVITFYTEYKGAKSLTKSTLEFNSVRFYERKINVNNEYVSTHYMRGIYEALPVGLGDLFTYDESKYQIDFAPNGRYHNDYDNALRVNVEVLDKRTKKTTTIDKNISGFKTLQQLADELIVSHKHEFLEKAKEKVSKSKDPNKTNFTNDLSGVFQNNWKNYLTIALSGGRELVSYGNENVLRGPVGYLDIYLERPRFILTSAELKEKDLHIKIQFQQANDVAIDKEYTMVIKGVKN